MSSEEAKVVFNKGLGWRPDLPDHRDFVYAASHVAISKAPPAVDLRSNCPPVYDQGAIGSCTGNAIAAAIQFDRMKNKQKPEFTPSRLFIYYNERVMEHSVKSDAGASLRDGIKSVHKQGVCPEDSGMLGAWIYDPSEFPGKNNHDELKPSKEAYQVALKHKVGNYSRISPTLNQLRGCLAEGYPFVFGIVCFDSIFDAPNGAVPMPSPNDAPVGGHAIMCVGYDDKTSVFRFRNSWGVEWGDKGYGTLPYAYLLNPSLAADFWTIRTIDS